MLWMHCTHTPTLHNLEAGNYMRDQLLTMNLNGPIRNDRIFAYWAV